MSTLDRVESKIEKTVELDKRGRPTKMLGMELTWEKDQVILTEKALIATLGSQPLAGDRSTRGKRSSPPQDPKSFELRKDEADQNSTSR